MPLLSICIPTYNRSRLLHVSLTSILNSVKGYEDKIEIVISDNASTDDTGSVIARFQKEYQFIRYHRNEQNVMELNYYVCAGLATGKYIWIYSDDDIMEANAVAEVLNRISQYYNLIIANHSLWTNDFLSAVKQRMFPLEEDITFYNHNTLLSQLGLRLGFISCVIIKRDIFFTLDREDYESYVEYGFPFLFSVYTAVIRECRAHIIAEPIFAQRGANSDGYMDKARWYKCFVTGSSLIFEELIKRGYSKEAVFRAKHSVIKDYVMHDISFRRRNGEKLNGLFSLMLPFYKRHWFFWIVCVPMLFLPKFFICMGNKIVNKLRFRCI